MELNKVLIVGNLGRDPVFKSTGSGKSVAEFSIGANQGRGENQETVWVDVTCWERTADFARNYLHKGSRVFVEGRLRIDKWTDKQSGQARSKLAVTAERVQFAESKAEAGERGEAAEGYVERKADGQQQADRTDEPRGESQRPAQQQESPAYAGETSKDDLPF